ncbi:MAG TPA: amidohydrolase family protein [Gemmatimonadales bacterium]
MIVDAHVHFWDPGALRYPWLEEIPSLDRAFLPQDYRAATGATPIGKIVFVEANCRPSEAHREVDLIAHLAESEPRLGGIVAFADLTDASGVPATLDVLRRNPRVRGIRHNIQGHPAGFCVQRAFVKGVQEVGRRGLTFDLCATHDQLGDVVQLVRQCPGTRFVLDHCGKPAIKEGRAERWRTDLAALALDENVACKVSGLLTEAAPEGWTDEDLAPYVDWVVECFGTQRVLYGSDWPVLTLAGSYCDWYGFTERFTAAWTAAERDRFYGGNAVAVYGL